MFDCIGRRVKIDIELKGADTAEPVAKLIGYYVANKGWSYNDFLVTSFDHYLLQEFNALLPDVSIGPIFSGLPIGYGNIIASIAADVVVLDRGMINEVMIDNAHQKGMQVFVFTVNRPVDIAEMKELGVVGIIPVLLTSSFPEQGIGEISFLSWPEIAVIISVATHTYSWIIMRKLVKEKSYSPMMINGLSMTFGGLLALITSFFVDGFAPIKEGYVLYFFGILSLIILLSNIICYNLYGWLLKRYTATFLSFSGFLSPLFTALYGWILLGEIVSWHFYVSCIVVFIGLYLFYQEELQEAASRYSGEVDLD